MASDWDEAAARKRLATYAAAKENCAESQFSASQEEAAKDYWELSEARENVDFWSVEDLTHCFAEIDRLRAENERLQDTVDMLTNVKGAFGVATGATGEALTIVCSAQGQPPQVIPNPERRRLHAQPCQVCKARTGEIHGSYCSVLG